MRFHTAKLFLSRFGCGLMVMVLTAVSQAESASEGRLKMRQDLIQFAIQHLPSMLLSYAYSLEKQGQLSPQMLMDYRLALHWLKNRDVISAFPIRFVQDREFKVHNIEINRLAINTGSEILMHADRLQIKPDFTVAEAVHTMLHEFNHLVKAVEDRPHQASSNLVRVHLNEKDAFATRVWQYLRHRTWVATHASSPSRYSVLDLEEPRDAGELMAMANESRYGGRGFRVRYLAWREWESFFQEDEKIHHSIFPEAARVFNLGATFGHTEFRPNNLYSYPRTEIQEVTMESNERVNVRMGYTERVFDQWNNRIPRLANPQQEVRLISINSEYGQPPVESGFSFRQILSEISFEIENSVVREKAAYITLALKDIRFLPTLDPQEIVKAGSFTVLARDTKGNRFSYPARLLRSKDGVHRIQFRMPQLFELFVTEIMVQQNLGQRGYKELSIRAQGPQALQFLPGEVTELKPARNKKLDTFDFWMGTSDHTVSLKLPYPLESVEGITFEILAPLEATFSEQRQFRFSRYYHVQGYKIFLDQKKLEKLYDPKFRELKIPLLGQEWNSFSIEGPPVSEGWVAETFPRWMTDTGLRSITNTWIHLKDGQNIKLRYDSPPMAKLIDRARREWNSKAKEQRRQEFERQRSCFQAHFN